MRLPLTSPVLLAILAASSIAYADTVTLSAVSRGAYDQAGNFATAQDGTASGNYLTGNGDPGYSNHSFFTFTLPSLSGSVTSAQLQLSTTVNAQFFGGGPSPVTFDLYVFSGSSTALDAGTAGVPGFNALASGTLAGIASIPTTEPAGTIISLDLNAAGLAAIQASQGSLFSLGGSIAGTTPNTFIFGNSTTTTTQLIVNSGTVAATPEPSSLMLLGTGLLGVLGAARRRYRIG